MTLAVDVNAGGFTGFSQLLRICPHSLHTDLMGAQGPFEVTRWRR